MTRRAAALFCVCLVAGGGVAAPARETLYLKSGAVVSGEVLKDRHDVVVMDLGFKVVLVPQDQVARREKEAYKRGSDAQAENGFFAVRRQPVQSVKDNIEQYGGGVVLVRTLNGLGSGFIVNPAGYVVTNFHVIAREQEVSVALFQKTEAGFQRHKIDGVRIVAVNPFLDLALLKFDVPRGQKLVTLALGDSRDVRAGEPVFAVGNPLGLERSVSEGIVSTEERSFGGVLYLQTTAPINPGNSGGPLFNVRGEVIGVTNMKAGWLTEGLSFAIPVDYLKDFLRNRDAFAFDKNNPNSGYHYLRPPRKPEKGGGKTPPKSRGPGGRRKGK